MKALCHRIIVSILNIDRNKGLTPTHTEAFTTSGGAAGFLEFLKSELLPYVNKKYQTNGNNILLGHSVGGLFVTYALLNEPNTFTSYIASGPSYWWDSSYLIKQAAAKLSSLDGKKGAFFISGREGQGLQDMHINQMDSLLRKNAPAGLAWKITAYTGESHSSVRLKSYYDGLRFVYQKLRAKEAVIFIIGRTIISMLSLPRLL